MATGRDVPTGLAGYMERRKKNAKSVMTKAPNQNTSPTVKSMGGVPVGGYAKAPIKKKNATTNKLVSKGDQSRNQSGKPPFGGAIERKMAAKRGNNAAGVKAKFSNRFKGLQNKKGQ